jgi:hypothetical protein
MEATNLKYFETDMASINNLVTNKKLWLKVAHNFISVSFSLALLASLLTPIQIPLSVRLHAYINSRPAKRIFIKFNAGKLR